LVRAGGKVTDVAREVGVSHRLLTRRVHHADVVGVSPEEPAVHGRRRGVRTVWNSGDFAPQWIEIDLGARGELAMRTEEARRAEARAAELQAELEATGRPPGTRQESVPPAGIEPAHAV